jgi:hypothetical protein
MRMININSINKFLLVSSLLILTQCAGLQVVTLEEEPNKSKYSTENALDAGNGTGEEINTPLLKDGVFENFEKDLVGWWGGDAFKFSKEKDFLKVDINKTSAGFPQFGYSFDPKDFSNASVVRIRMRMEGESAKVRLDLRDVNELSTNSTLVINEVVVSNEYKDYYFDFNNKYKQSWPDNGIVDPRQIATMIFFINPGERSCKGTLYIKEIYVMANKDGSGMVSKELLVDDFTGDINYWYGCDKERVILSKEGETMKVDFKSGQWACIGVGFESKDASNASVIKIRMKITGDGKMQAVDVLPYFIDDNNKTSNGFNIPQKVVIGIDYVDYFFDYRGKMKSEEGPFNAKAIQGITIFLNTQGTSAFNGSVYFDEISFVPEVPAYISKRIAITKPTFIDPSWIKGSNESTIDNFTGEIKDWTVSNPKLIIGSENNQAIKITSDGAGPDWEHISKSFAAINITEKPVIKVRIKADGNNSPSLRIILTDNYGNLTNARPAEEKIILKGEYQDYYFDFTGRFQQRFPVVTNVNPGAIQKINLYINGGMEFYNGNIYIDEVQAVSVSDYLKAVK